jgi:hypothetical protein
MSTVIRDPGVPVTDFLADKRQEITNRLKELKPKVEEYQRLEDAENALAGLRRNGKPHRGPGRPRGSRSRKPAATNAGKATAAKAGRKPRASAGRKPGRRKGSGHRAAEALRFVTEQPGITIPELAKKMRIKQNYLYRVLPRLQAEGSVKKDARGWHPAKQKAAS